MKKHKLDAEGVTDEPPPAVQLELWSGWNDDLQRAEGDAAGCPREAASPSNRGTMRMRSRSPPRKPKVRPVGRGTSGHEPFAAGVVQLEIELE